MDAPYVHPDTDPAVASELREMDDVHEEPKVWVFPSLGLGGGTARLGPIVTTVTFEAHAFLSPHLSLGVRGGLLAAGEPDGNGDATRSLIGLVGYRWNLTTSPAHEGYATRTTWLQLAAGAGWMELQGYTQSGTNRHDYDVSSVVLDGRVSVIWTWGVFLTAIGVDAIGAPGQGFAAVPNVGVGLGF